MSCVDFISIFDTRSQRVKGIAFHPTRPWLLASLHTGVIQLWDYRIRTLIDKFGDHDGPVRSVDFHPSQPMFVSGGDDYRIKVWNYKERQCLFTLSGHLDYIRTVQFHHEYPWILSCSDDQTIRIWNWQSRQCIATLTGHSHYVMSARFHPTDDLVVSASLDQTVRVWDISALRRKNIMPQAPPDETTKIQNELFGNMDTNVRFVLEGHERGVNWAAFHSTMPLIISGADDRSLKMWRYNESKAWEVDTLRGHYNNVSCALFHPRADLLITNSEDKTLRVWDVSKRQVIHTHRREHDRFWYLVAHPRLNLFAAGHDNGLIVFKLSRERPPSAAHQGVLYFIKDRYVRSYDIASNKDAPVVALRAGSSKFASNARSLLYSARDHAVIVTFSTGQTSGVDDSSSSNIRYEVYALPANAAGAENVQVTSSGTGLAVAWVKRARLAVLVKSTVVQICTPSGEVVKKITPPYPTDAILPAPTDLLLFRSDDRVALFDVQQERVVGELKVSHVRGAVWQEGSGVSADGPYVALLCKGALVICNRRLERIYHVPETLRLKSGVWDEQGIFIYSTPAHIKFCLPPSNINTNNNMDMPKNLAGRGDHGILRTLDRPVYIVAANSAKAQLVIVDRNARVRVVPIDTTEYQFKRSLALKKFDEVLKMVRNKALIGKAVVGYLQRVGYPELALHFVQDPMTRFQLALEASHANNIDIALQAAQTLNEAPVWKQLGSEALRQGNVGVVEKASQQTLDFERLSFLYSVTGNQRNLGKMLSIATNKRHDANAQFYNALLLGDVEARVKVLEQSGQYQLAYLTARTHGLAEAAGSIHERLQAEHNRRREEQGLEPEELVLPEPKRGAKALLPLIPLYRAEPAAVNWPHTRTTRGPFDAIMLSGALGASANNSAPSRLRATDDDEELAAAKGTWGEDELELSGEEKFSSAEDESKKDSDEELEGGGWGEDELELDEELDKVAKVAETAITLPPAGAPHTDNWARSSTLAADHVAAGQFDSAMRLLNEQLGIVNFVPLKPAFMQIFRSRFALLPLHSSLTPFRSFLNRPPIDSNTSTRTVLPRIPPALPALIESLSQGYKAFTAGKFSEALELFRSILHQVPLLVVQNRTEANEVKEMVTICREYVLGLVMELKRRELAQSAANAARVLELAALFTHVQLQPKHQHLVHKLAANAAAKAKNYALADDIARRLLDLSPPSDLQDHCDKVIRLCEQKGRTDEIKVKYDSRNPFVICGGTLQPIYKGSPNESCPFCGATFIAQAKGRRCTICQLSEIGKQATGLQLFEGAERRR